MTPLLPPVVDTHGSALCTQCGLCCTGALHNFAVLEPEETDFARRIGMTLRTEGRPGFALPCHFLRDSACTIYADRPKVCARYKCGLLDRLEAGTISLDEALEKVAEAKALVAQAATEMTSGMTLPAARAMSTQPPTPGLNPEARTDEMRLRLKIIALSLFLDKNFRNSREGKALSIEAIGDTRLTTEMK